MSEEMTETYDNWDDSLEEDRKSTHKSSGKKYGLRWSPSEAPSKIHLGRPETPYIHPKSGKGFPFRTGSRHFIPGGGKNHKGAFIECGLLRSEPCVPDAYANPQAFGLEGVAPDARFKKLDAKLYYGVAGWIEEEFHLVEYENTNGEGTHKKRNRCEGRGCELCKDGWPIVFGNRMYMEISPGQWRHAFHDLHKRIENSSCKCGGQIYVTHFSCANPECDKLVLDVCASCDCGKKGEVSIDVEAGRASCSGCKKTWSAFYTDHQKLYEESNESYKCSCRHEGFLKPNRICATENCPVDPYGIFDCQLTIRVTGAKKEKRIIIDDYAIQEPDARLFDVQYQGGVEDEMAPKVAEANAKPLDLDYLLAPLSPDEQAKELGKPNPFNAAAQGARFARYKKGEEGEAQASEEAGATEAEVAE